MNVRIVVADERQANFFDAVKPSAPLTRAIGFQVLGPDVILKAVPPEAFESGHLQ